MSTRLLWWIVWISVLAGTASAQKVELTAFVGGQTNGGLDLSTSLFQRIDVQNGMNYGLSAGICWVNMAASNSCGTATGRYRG
jgi:hypothetical protein